MFIHKKEWEKMRCLAKVLRRFECDFLNSKTRMFFSLKIAVKDSKSIVENRYVPCCPEITSPFGRRYFFKIEVVVSESHSG